MNEKNLERDSSFIAFPLESEVGGSELPGHCWLVLGSACSVERILPSWSLVSRTLTSWTPFQAMEQFLIVFCSTDSFLLDWLVYSDPITGGFSCSHFSNLCHGPLLASALRLDGFEVILSLALWPIFVLLD